MGKVGKTPSHLCGRHCVIILVKHGIAYTVLRVMNVFNGKGHFSGSWSSETDRFSKNGNTDYVGDMTRHANFEINRLKGALLRMREVVAVRRQWRRQDLRTDRACSRA